MATISAPFHGRTTELHIAPSISGAISASTLIGDIDDMSALETTRATVDLLAYGDDDMRKLVGARDNGSVTITLNWNPGEQSHEDLHNSFIAGTKEFFAIQWVSGADSARADFEAYITSYGISHPKEDKVTATVELVIDGPVTYDLTPI
jgi:hypothetical protein